MYTQGRARSTLHEKSIAFGQSRPTAHSRYNSVARDASVSLIGACAKHEPVITLRHAMMQEVTALEWKRASHVAFAVFVLSWIVFRMILYPFVYVRSTYTESSALHDGGMSVQALNCFIALLSILCLLNLFWFGMMVKLVYALLANGDAEDPTVEADKEEEPAWVEEEPAWVVTKNDDDDDDASGISDNTSTTYIDSDTHDEDTSLDDQ